MGLFDWFKGHSVGDAVYYANSKENILQEFKSLNVAFDSEKYKDSVEHFNKKVTSLYDRTKELQKRPQSYLYESDLIKIENLLQMISNSLVNVNYDIIFPVYGLTWLDKYTSLLEKISVVLDSITSAIDNYINNQAETMLDDLLED